MSWQTIRLGDFLTLKRGYDLPSARRQEGSSPVVSSSGITGYHNVGKVEGPGVVTGRYGTLGQVFFVPEDFWPLNTALYVQDFKGNDPRFSAYFLKSILTGTSSDKAAVPGINRNDLHARKVNVTRDRSQQRAIASILSAYDDLIENNRRRIQLLEQSARLLYKEWFVHLRFPGHEHVKIKNGVPEGWKKGCVGNLAEVKSGYAFKSKDWQSEGIPVIKIKNIVGDGIIDVFNCDCVSDNIADMASKYEIPRDTLLIAMTGATVGKVGIMPNSPRRCLLNQRVGQFRSKYDNPIERFIFPFFQGGFAQTQVQNLAGGAAQPNISGGQIESIELVIPEKKIMLLYLVATESIFQQRQNLLQQNERLIQARDLLLPRLMNGEVVV